MRKKGRTAAVIALSAVFACGILSGCDQITTDSSKDFARTVATVDITKSEEFAEGGVYAGLKDVVGEVSIIKREMIESFMASGYSAMQTYGWSYETTFNSICDSLVNRRIYVQFAKAYLLNAKDADGKELYSVEDYRKVIAEDSDGVESLKFFLDEKEEAKALYDTRVAFNEMLDSQEQTKIQSSSDTNDVTVRTLPTGADVENEDYYDETYRIYTGMNNAANCGSYEKLDGSTPTTRRDVYDSFLGNLRSNEILRDGENVSDIESLDYFKSQLKSQYESVILNKLTDLFEERAENFLTQSWLETEFNDIYEKQREAFADDASTFESQLDSISDDTFLLTAPEAAYGYVVNILLPFSTTQSDMLSSLSQDYGDEYGNNFVQRANLLKNIVAYDQRESWFTGETDYSFDASTSDAITSYYNGGKAERKYLFFEEGLIADYSKITNDALEVNYTDKHTAVPNYYGRYGFNGSVSYDEKTKTYEIKPTGIKIDEFISEMEGYLTFAGLTVGTGKKTENYFVQPSSYYYKQDGAKGEVDYSKFIYYENSVRIPDFNANNLFVAGTTENLAYSVINELAFAYNTDTSCLNTYLGYSVVTGKTNYVGEFEYAAQKVCEQGAGSYAVVPSDYGWHIIYCSFSFLENNGTIKPFTFDYNDINLKGSFSNLFYEAQKATQVSEYSSNMQTQAINAFNNENCVTVYKDRYKDLTELG